MKFVAKSKEYPDDVKKARVVRFDIYIPPSLTKNTMVGPILRKRWTEFVSSKLMVLLNRSGIISDEEMKRMEKAPVAAVWDGRIESLLAGNRRMLDQVQKMVVKEMDQYPLGSMTSNEDERNRYIISQYKERLDYMVNHSQIVADGLQPNQEEYGMKRLLNSLLFSATEYHLESPLWKYIIIHLHDGDYEGLTRKGEDQHFHLSVPYMYDEKELIPFLNRNLSQLKQIYDSKDFVKKIS
ncbi:hypothetical protein WA171_002771 [Blastocystis sp. BT1]